MEQCWAGEPSQRPLLGVVLPVLESIREKAEQGKSEQQQDFLKTREAGNLSSLTKSPALSLTEPFNQRGVTTNLQPPKQPRHVRRLIKHPVINMTNFFSASTCPNFYVQMREF